LANPAIDLLAAHSRRAGSSFVKDAGFAGAAAGSLRDP